MMNRSESLDNTCPVCHDVIEIYAVGPCDHPVCYRCSTRMRVLCEKADCPICRSMMPQVVFVREKLVFRDINLRDCIPNRRNKIFYEDEDIEEKYLNLLEFRCRICPNRKSERTLVSLQTHMKREHQLFACDLCLSHLKIFPYERKFYNRKNLAIHRRVGDPDDKSYKGHPLCEFCDVRYNDKDELMKHLRKDHYYCHFCDQQGSNAYYNEYPDLKEHFQANHFLCSEDMCGDPQTQFTHAFSSEIDLKAHKAKFHNKNMSKFQSREARQIEIDFQLHPRRQGYNGRGAANEDYEDSRRGGRGGSRYSHRRHQRDDPDLLKALAESMEMVNGGQAPAQVQERVPDPVHDFPTLNGAPAVSVQSVQSKPQKKSPEEDFPTLNYAAKSQGSGLQTQTYSKAYASVMSYQSDLSSAVKSAPVQKEKGESKPVVLGSVSSRSKQRWSEQAPKITEENFPSLGSSSSASSSSFMSDWSKTSSPISNVESHVSVIPKSFAEEKSKVVKSKTPKQLDKNIEDEKEFPVLGGSSRENSALSNLLWSKPKSSKKINVQPRSQKVDDDSFVLPESYYKTYEQGEVPVDKKEEERVRNEGASVSLSKNKDFPSLPVRESSKASANSDKKKKNSPREKKAEVKSEKSSEAKSKKRQNGHSSLSAIAEGLVVNEDKSRQIFKDKTNKGSVQANINNNHSKPAKSKPPDWFDNPPVEQVPEKSTNYTIPAKQSILDDVSSENSSAIDNSFPSLHTMSTPIQDTRPPPGFSPNPQLLSASSVNVAPPGFSKPLAAPPGFSSIKTAPSYLYIEPADFSARNRQLVQEIRSCLITVEDGFQSFKALSGQYRQGLMDGNDYYLKCQKLMGEEDFSIIFPELIALLPDIAKQQELWAVHQTANSNKSKASQYAESETLWKQNNTMSLCPKCEQIVLSKDEQHHNLQHGENTDFPTLGDVASKRKGSRDVKEAGSSVKGAWIKAK